MQRLGVSKMLQAQDLPLKMEVTPQQSELLQKAYFELGGKWGSGSTEIQHTDCPFLVLGTFDTGMTASKKYAVYYRREGKVVDPLEVLGGSDHEGAV